MESKALLSSKFDLSSMSWSEIREIPIPELGEDMKVKVLRLFVKLGIDFGSVVKMVSQIWKLHSEF